MQKAHLHEDVREKLVMVASLKPILLPPYKGILIGEVGSSEKAVPLIIKDDYSLGIYGRIQKVIAQINWTNIALKGLEMNVAKTQEQKECFKSLEVAVKSVNQSLNDVNFSVSVLEGFVRESAEGIIDRVRFESLTSHNLIQDLLEKN